MTSLDARTVGIIIPTRNRFDLTRAAIASVQAQTYRDWNLYVVDDASDDGSGEALAELFANDSRITLLRRPKGEGASAARQAGLEASTAPLIATLDSDDVWLPGKLEAQVDALLRASPRRQDVGVVLCWHKYLDLGGVRRSRVVKPDVQGASNPFPSYNMSTALITRWALDRAGGFLPAGIPRLPTAEHLEFFLRLTSVALVAVVPRLLVRCRHHPGPRNTDALGRPEAARESATVLRMYDERLAGRPRERAWLRAMVGARYLHAGDRRTGLAHLASGLVAASPTVAARMVRHYAPFIVKQLVVSPPDGRSKTIKTSRRGAGGEGVGGAVPLRVRVREADAEATMQGRAVIDRSVQPAASIVVMAYRNERTVAAAVRSVLKQGAFYPIEVIVVTSGGDGAAKVARDEFPDVTVVETPIRLLPGRARNAGAAAASGQIVAFLAGDCEAEPGWLAGRLAAHRAGHLAVASAITHTGSNRLWAWASYYGLFAARMPGRPASLVSPPDPAAHSLSFDRALLDRIGPFDESLPVGEDTEAARRLADLGVGIWFEPSVRTAHRGPTGPLAMLSDHYRRGARLYRFLALTGRRNSARSPAHVLASNAVLFVKKTRWTLSTCWRYARGERWRVALSLPWILAARAAGAAGTASEELRATRALRYPSRTRP